jgi:hypothetical protein
MILVFHVLSLAVIRPTYATIVCAVLDSHGVDRDLMWLPRTSPMIGESRQRAAVFPLVSASSTRLAMTGRTNPLSNSIRPLG